MGDHHRTSNTTYSHGRGDDPRARLNYGGGKYAGPRSHAKDAKVTSSNDVVKVGRGGHPGSSQDYNTLARELKSSGASLFEDPDFPADSSSLFYKDRLPQKLEWKRPTEIVSHPKFIENGASRFDVRQGELGDCWLLAGIASLSMYPELLNKVVPQNQNFESSSYCGLFRFNFWRFGKWEEVVVDDLLPTYHNRLVFMHSESNSEFWSALLEKAYAKICGSYEALRGGSTSEAMEDFTGGITEMFDLKTDAPSNLFEIMMKACSLCSLMGCSIDADPRQLEAKLPNGLIMGHAYSITDVKMVDINTSNKKGKIPLVRVRNPWGNEDEWTGAWSDKSREWQFIPQDERQRIGLTFDSDGEFWMSFQDFSSNFEKLEICHLGPQSMNSVKMKGKHKMAMSIENGEWKRRLNAGGCRNYLDTFWTNPQFRVKVIDVDVDDDDDMGTLIVGLMQKNMRRRRREGVDNHTIGYAIFKTNDSNALKDNQPGTLDLNFFKRNSSVAKSPSFVNLREVCGRHRLPPGEYCVLPSTFQPGDEAEFIVRIFSEKPTESSELDEVTDMTAEGKPKPAISLPVDESQDQALKAAFNKVAGIDMEIDAYELKNILNAAFLKDFKFDGFSNETCRSMVALLDVDQSGKLGFEEFRLLWNDLRLWKTIFKKFDVDKSGNFNGYELRQTLHAVGFKVSNAVFNCLVMRYANHEGTIEFDEFILICTRLKAVFETFKVKTKSSRGDAMFNLDDYIQSVMYT